FLLFTNVGLFYDLDKPPLVPDALVSLDVEIPKDIWSKSKRSYFLRGYGKPPEVVIEVVSDKKGDETGEKMRKYAQIKVPHYVIFDPFNYLKKGKLRIYRLRGNKYAKQKGNRLPEAELSLTFWTGVYENMRDIWLRWCDRKGNLLLTGEEQAQREQKRLEYWQAKREQQRAEREKQSAMLVSSI
ncbi:MAG: Uma2 family endonuclease, partial [Gammaproteobacteria bacterium]|nr:Uma2 family endonuclease [Gammaproteobacteria bacterium]